MRNISCWETPPYKNKFPHFTVRVSGLSPLFAARITVQLKFNMLQSLRNDSGEVENDGEEDTS